MKSGNPILREFNRSRTGLLLLNFLMLGMAGVVRTVGVGNVGRITGEMERGAVGALLSVVGVSIALILLSYVLRWAAGGLCMGLSNQLAAQLRVRLVRHLEGLSFQQYESREKGNLQSVISNDVNVATEVIYILHSRILTNVFVYVTSAVYLLWIDRIMGTVIILFSLFLGGMNHMILNRIREHEKGSRKALGEISNTVQHAFAGIDTIRAYGGEEFIMTSFSRGKKRYNGSCLKTEVIDSWRLTFYNIISNTAFFAAMFFLGAKGIRGEMDLEKVLSFLMILRQIMTPMEVILRWMTSLVRCDVSWGRIYEVLEEPAEERREWGRIPGEARRVEAKDMSFSYERKRLGGREIESGKAVFKDLDIGLAKGRLTLLKGKSGSGKTTLIKLLLGLYHGDEGREKLCVDGREAPFGQLGVSAAFSEAESAVFCMSVYDNLRMGNENVTKMRCRELFGELGFGDWIDSLPQGLDTVLSESGGDVSGGQRQILAVMRAILTDRPILILDEPFVALDREHGYLLEAYLEKLKEKRFILLVSHREEFCQNGCEIVQL